MLSRGWWEHALIMMNLHKTLRDYLTNHHLDSPLMSATQSWYSSTLLEKVGLQLKLLPKETYAEIFGKAREVILIRISKGRHDSSCKSCQGSSKVKPTGQMEETLRVMTEQLAAISINRASPHTKCCFKCRRLDHIVSNCCGCPKPSSWEHSQELIKAQPVVHVPTLAHNSHTAYARGQLNNNSIIILLDSGASCSDLRKDHMSSTKIGTSTSASISSSTSTGISTSISISISTMTL